METLPPEIVSAIFELVPPTYHCHFTLAQGSVTAREQALLPLLLVSRLWRDIAYGTLALWSAVEVSPETPFKRIEERLRRVATGKLDIIIVDSGEMKVVGDSVQALEALQRRSRQWRTLCIMEESKTIGSRISPNYRWILPDEVPNLEEASFQVKSRQDSVYTRVSAPRLRTLSIYQALLVLKDFKGLRRLHIDDDWLNTRWSEYVQLMQSNLALETLELGTCSARLAYHQQTGQAAVHLDSLKDLSVTYGGFHFLPSIYSSSLTTIRLAHILDPEPDHKLLRCYPNLQSIHVKQSILSDAVKLIQWSDDEVSSFDAGRSHRLTVEVDGWSAGLHRTAGKERFAELKVCREWLSEHVDVVWLPYDSWSLRYTSWEDANRVSPSST